MKYKKSQIKSIEIVDYNDYVYDITLENQKLPYFYANNILTHNSAYPHAILMGNLFSQTDTGWHGDNYYNIIGTYNNKEQGKIENALKEILIERLKAKKSGDKAKSSGYKIVINCFSEDTEIITEKGVQLLKDCKINDRVYSINPITEEIELKEIEKMFEQTYIGDMINFKDKNKDLLVTPNHDMLFQTKHPKNKIKRIQAQNLIGRKGKFPKCRPIKGIKKRYIDMKEFTNKNYIYKIKLNNPYATINRYNLNLIYDGNTTSHLSINGYDKKLKGEWFIQGQKRDMMVREFILTKDLFYLIGIVLSEGCLKLNKEKHYENKNYRGISYGISISQYKKIHPEIFKKIRNCLDNIGIRYSTDEKTYFRISSLFWYNFFKEFKNKSRTCFIPEWVFEYDYSLLKYLYEGLYDGDGSKGIQNNYATASNELKNGVVRLNLHLGYKSSCKFRWGCWRICRIKSSGWYHKGHTYIIKNPTDKIICCSVKDNHTLMAGRNGKFVWTGQSLYGLTGNPVFKSLYNHTTASDCTSIVRTWLKKLAKTLEEYGFIVLYGFTDNVIILIPENSNKEELMYIVEKYISEIKSHLPFPMDTFNLELETEMKFIYFVARNCYLYVTNKDEVKYKSTLLNTNTPKVIMDVFNEYMKPKIIKELDVNFTERELEEQIRLRLMINPELASEEYKVIESDEYKVESSIHYQIAHRYGSGTHFLIPNVEGIGVGRGKSVRLCSIEEFNNNHLTVDDISLRKLIMHLKPFIKIDKQKQIDKKNAIQHTLF